MISYKLKKLRIGNLYVDKPIIQGGMGVGISLSGLASSVANEGGIGVISSVGLGLLYPTKGKTLYESNLIATRNEIRKTRKLTNGIIGINIMYAITDFDVIIKIAIEEEIDIIFIGAGLPLKIPEGLQLEKLKNINTKIIPIVSSARAANIIFNIWDKKFGTVPDGVVVEGPLAGGHLGFKTSQIKNDNYSLEKLLPDVITSVKPYEVKFGKNIPVIAAGGIYSGADIYEIMKQGANGVQMGTRFVATDECDASNKFKMQYINCRNNDIGIINSPVGLPGRSIINGFLKDVEQGKKIPIKCPYKCLKTCNYETAPYCIALALINAQKGKFTNGFAFCGENASKIDKIISVKELMLTLEKEYEIRASIDGVNNELSMLNSHQQQQLY